MLARILNCLRAFWHWYKGIFCGRPWYVKILSTLASLIVALILWLIAVDINFLWLFGKSPSMQTVVNKRPAQASLIYSADSVLIGKYFSQNRTPVTYDDVNPVFWQALVDTEDERFYHHFGIDFQALFAAIKDYAVHSNARGASTITQQLAKNLFRVRTEYSTGLLGNIPGLKMLIMKSKEWITAVKLEMTFSKEEILTMYANTVDFGSNAFGINTAAKTYFDTTPRQLTASQAAVLVGMLKATTYYNPRLHPDRSRQRRNVVLDLMAAHGHLAAVELDSLKASDITLDYNVESTYDGIATYFREALAAELRGELRSRGYNLDTDGLTIYTTIDTRLQQYAEAAVLQQMEQLQKTFDNHWGNTNPWQDEQHREIPNFIENIAKRLPIYKRLTQQWPDTPDSVWAALNRPHTVRLFSYKGPVTREMSTLDSIRYMEHFLHTGFVAIEPQTGHVKAWVGDVDFDTWKYDKVTAKRQPGSTFKLFVYAEAMNQGLTPCDRRQDSYFAMKAYDPATKQEKLWAPTNANGYFTGANMLLKSAFAQSTNSVAVKLGQEVGIDRIVATAKAMGIQSELAPTPSLALGSSDVELYELVSAYSTVANNGEHAAPTLITRILDRDGNEVYSHHVAAKRAIPYRSAFFLQQLLQAGMREPGGTSMNMWRYVRAFPDTDFGGKTGTSNNHSDAWYVAVSPRLTCGAWVGGEYRAIHFRTGQLGQGSRTALPICGLFIEKALADKNFSHYRAKFDPPRDASIQPEEYMCQGTYEELSDSLASDSLATDSIAPIDARTSLEE